jgi:hypothetical protein
MEDLTLKITVEYNIIDGCGMICRMICRPSCSVKWDSPPSTAIRSLVPSPCSSAIRATGGDMSHRPQSGPWGFIRDRDLRADSQESETKYIIAMTINSGEKRIKLKE